MNADALNDDRDDIEAPNASFEAWVTSLRHEHLDAAELDAAVLDAASSWMRRAFTHLQDCPACLDRLSARIQGFITDNRTGIDDWTPLLSFLAHQQPMVRAASAKTASAIASRSAEVLSALNRLQTDADETVRSAATTALAAVTGRTNDESRKLPRPIAPFFAGTLHLESLAAASRVDDAESPPAAPARYWSPDRLLCVEVTGGVDGPTVVLSTEHKWLAGALVEFELVPIGSGEPSATTRVIEISLEKVAGVERWQGTWSGTSTAEHFEIHVVSVRFEAGRG